MEKEEVFICDCHSLEHHFVLWYDEEDNELHLTVHLVARAQWWKRIMPALRYIFGYNGRYGEYDNVILQPEDRDRLIKNASKLKPQSEAQNKKPEARLGVEL